MNISPLTPHVHASELPLEQIAKNKNLTEEEKVGELSRQFEAVLLRQILKDVRKSVIKSGLTPEAAGSDIYNDMVTNQLAEGMSKSGAFGFAKSLEHDLARQIVRNHAGKEPKVEN
jgi:Rod binding domain-containing protein